MKNSKWPLRESLYGVLAVVVLQSAPVPMARADEEPSPTQPAKPTLGVTMPKTTLGVGDIAPPFALSLSDGNVWSSRDQLAQHAMIILFDGEHPVFEHWFTNAAFVRTVKQLQESGVTAVLASARPDRGGQVFEQRGYVRLHDENGELRKAFGGSSVSIAAVDRAGFVRRLIHSNEVPVTNATKLGTLLMQISDPTPKLEVGKPAPDFTVTDMNGQVRRLSDQRGKKNLLLTFFPKCFTGG
jgi:peroxiredoxin